MPGVAPSTPVPVRPRGAVLTGRRPVTGVRALATSAGLALLDVAVLASIAFGARTVGLHDVLGGLAAALGGDPSGVDGVSAAAVQKRIPRTLLAVLVGAALGVSGAVMQGVTRNPLAEPGLLGISTGASLAVVAGIAFFGMRSPTAYIWVAIAGAAAWAAFGSLISIILLPRMDVINQFRFWQVGGVGGGSFGRIAQMVPFLLAGAPLCPGVARGLNSMALGDDVAAGLGERVGLTRLLAWVGAVTLTGAATAVAGPIAFVGLVVPHVGRLLVGIDHRWLLPASAVAGASLR